MKKHHSVGRFLSCLYRHSQMYFDQQLSQFDLSYGTLSFLMILFHHDGIHQEEISRKLSIDKATTARAIHKLAKMDFVRREMDPADRRAYFIYLTEKGMALEPDIKKIAKDWSEKLTSGFNTDEQQQIFRFLEKMSRNAATQKTKIKHS